MVVYVVVVVVKHEYYMQSNLIKVLLIIESVCHLNVRTCIFFLLQIEFRRLQRNVSLPSFFSNIIKASRAPVNSVSRFCVHLFPVLGSDIN